MYQRISEASVVSPCLANASTRGSSSSTSRRKARDDRLRLDFAPRARGKLPRLDRSRSAQQTQLRLQQWAHDALPTGRCAVHLLFRSGIYRRVRRRHAQRLACASHRSDEARRVERPREPRRQCARASRSRAGCPHAAARACARACVIRPYEAHEGLHRLWTACLRDQ
jgi:hypothetical protein